MYDNGFDFDYNSSSERRELYEKIRPFLHGDEQLVWLGAPSKIKSHTGFILIFALFWLAFSLFWTVTATAAGGLFGLFGLPFVGIGIWLLYFSVFGSKKALKNSVYAVTDKRAVILNKTGKGINCTEYFFSNIDSVNLENVNGSIGDIRFASNYTYGYPGDYNYGNRRSYNLGSAYNSAFLGIENVQQIYMLISEKIGKNN